MHNLGPNYANLNSFRMIGILSSFPSILVIRIQFELKGDTGQETIEISNREGSLMETIQLSTEWKKFTYHVPENQPIIIHFLSGHAGDVFLKNADKYDVINPDAWEKLGCRIIESINDRNLCKEIRNGIWKHKGAYEIKPKVVQGMFKGWHASLMKMSSSTAINFIIFCSFQLNSTIKD